MRHAATVKKTLLSGRKLSKRGKASLKTFVSGLADIILQPFRTILLKLVQMVDENIDTSVPIVGRFNKKLSEQLATSGTQLKDLQKSLRELPVSNDDPGLRHDVSDSLCLLVDRLHAIMNVVHLPSPSHLAEDGLANELAVKCLHPGQQLHDP